TTLLPLLSSPLLPFRCEGSIKVTVTDPRTGIQGTAEVGWKKDVKTGKITTTIPPHSPAQTIKVNGIEIGLPANNSNQGIPSSAEVTDPVIVQVPLSWTLTGATVATPIGSGSMVITSTAIPASAAIDASGLVSFASYYKAEAGGKLYMGDYPAGLAADGPTS